MIAPATERNPTMMIPEIPALTGTAKTDPIVVEPAQLLTATTAIVCAHLGRMPVEDGALPELIQSVHAALAQLGQPTITPTAGRPEPAVSIRASIKPDHIVCLEDGAKLKMLKRYLAARFGMTPEQYRARWGLPADYPMVAPDYAAKRRELALSIGLGRKRGK